MSDIKMILDQLDLKQGTPERLAAERALRKQLHEKIIALRDGAIDPVAEALMRNRTTATTQLDTLTTAEPKSNGAPANRKSGLGALSTASSNSEAHSRTEKPASEKFPPHGVGRQTRTYTTEHRTPSALTRDHQSSRTALNKGTRRLNKRVIPPIKMPFDLALVAAAAEPTSLGWLNTDQGKVEFFNLGGTMCVRFSPTSEPKILTMGSVDFKIELPKGVGDHKTNMFVVPHLEEVLVKHFLGLNKRSPKRTLVKWK